MGRVTRNGTGQDAGATEPPMEFMLWQAKPTCRYARVPSEAAPGRGIARHRPREQKIPKPHKKQNDRSDTRMLSRNAGWVCGVTEWPPMNTENATVMIVMLVIMPRVRMLAVRPEATPR